MSHTAQKLIWKRYTLKELLPYAIVFLDWQDGYEKYGEGSCLAYLDGYEMEFNDAYSVWSIRNDKGNVFQMEAGALCLLWEVLMDISLGSQEINTLGLDPISFREVLLEKIEEENSNDP